MIPSVQSINIQTLKPKNSNINQFAVMRKSKFLTQDELKFLS